MLHRLVVAAKRFGSDERGATAIEYGLIAAMVAVGMLIGLTLLGGGASNLFGSVSDKSAVAMSGG